MEANTAPVQVAATAEEKEAAAKDFAEKFGAMTDALNVCVVMGVDIMAELATLGVDLPPFAAALFPPPTS